MTVQDAHVHIQDSADRPGFLRTSSQQGVGRLFCNASGPDDWQSVLDLAAEDERIIPFIGVHPWKSACLPEGWAERLESLSGTRMCGIGEIGLDTVRKGLDFGKQLDVCAFQVELAVRLKCPFCVHCVAAWRSLLDLLQTGNPAQGTFMVHAYSGPADVLRELVSRGAYISFRTLSNLTADKEALVRLVPDHRLLLESDYPYLAGKRPQEVTAADGTEHIAQIYRDAARIRAVPLEQLSAQVWENGTVFTHAIAHR